MTHEEAIKNINALNAVCGQKDLYDAEFENALALAIDALEKQIPKNPRETRCALMCARCGHKITEKGCKKLYRNYCKKCGQAIDWRDAE